MLVVITVPNLPWGGWLILKTRTTVASTGLEAWMWRRIAGRSCLREMKASTLPSTGSVFRLGDHRLAPKSPWPTRALRQRSRASLESVDSIRPARQVGSPAVERRPERVTGKENRRRCGGGARLGGA